MGLIDCATGRVKLFLNLIENAAKLAKLVVVK